MILRKAHLTLALLAVLAGCGLGPRLLAPVTGVTGGTGIVAAPKDAAKMEVSLPSRNIRFPMSLLDTDGPVQTWTASDGTQIMLRNGILISTRGLGLDLMSASVPAPADLVRGGHERVHYYTDGADISRSRRYTCTMEPAENPDGPAVAHRVDEVCTSESGRIRNQFWLNSGLKVVKSRQWVSSGVGYVVFSQP